MTACLNIDGDNKHRYILATQDETLRAEMRAIPGVPMMYIRRAVMIMEPPSPASLAKRDTREREKLGSVEKRKRVEDDGEDGDAEPTRKKRKATKEPNPKSVMKKKKKPNPMERRKEERREDGEAVASDNIIGEISDSVRRSKSVRRRKSHKKASKGMEDSIPALPNAEGEQS
jgi:U3 small nucleolar RNA-associated protein 23